MLITEDQESGNYRIKSYEPGEIVINDTTYHQSLIITGNELITNWRPTCLEEVNQQDLDCIIHLKPTVLLLGTGEHFMMPSSTLLHYLQEQHIGVECMHTRAACRTFMILAAEGRKVAAALLL